MKKKHLFIVLFLVIAWCRRYFAIRNEVIHPPFKKQKSLVGGEKKKTCHWTILAGDSNTRELHEHWLSAEQKLAKRNVIPLNRSGSLLPPSRLPNGHTHHDGPYVDVPLDLVDCFYIREPREDMIHKYADKEYLILQRKTTSNPFPFDEGCHILSTKFMQHQEGVKRYARNFSNSDFCGTSIEALPDGYERPSKPDYIWFTHGFWNLPNSWGRGTNHSNLDCSTRFNAVLEAFGYWRNQSIPFIWQTLFPINKHPVLTNAYIKWDHKCQMITSKQHHIPVFDVFSKVNRKRDIRNKDFHWKPSAIKRLLNVMWIEMFGGQKKYLGATMMNGVGVGNWHKNAILLNQAEE